MLHGGGSRHPVRSRETQRGALEMAARLLGALAHLPGPLCADRRPLLPAHTEAGRAASQTTPQPSQGTAASGSGRGN